MPIIYLFFIFKTMVAKQWKGKIGLNFSSFSSHFHGLYLCHENMQILGPKKSSIKQVEPIKDEKKILEDF